MSSGADQAVAAVRRFLKRTAPRYLQKLPFPSTLAGFQKLTKEEWQILGPFLLAVALLFIGMLSDCFSSRSEKPKKAKRKNRVNTKVDLDNPKVVTKENIADIEDTMKKCGKNNVYCRCWKSKKFPMCDGSHVKHNKETGDNVGPLIIEQKDD